MSRPARPPSMGWRLVPYITATGRCQVLDFLAELRAQTLTRFVFFQEVLRPEFERRGPFSPYWEALGDGWYDIKWGRCRIYCSVETERQILMYAGCVKLWREFAREHRRMCERGRADFMSNNYDQEQRELMYRGQ